MQIALFATLQRPHAVGIVRQLTGWLLVRGHVVRMAPDLAAAADCPDCAVDTDAVVNGSDLSIAVGGDGTMLGAVRASALSNVPVLGVNAGDLGFLTQLTPDQLYEYLPHVLAGEYIPEERLMLRARILRGDDVVNELLAFNDIVVRQGPKGRIIRLDVKVAGHHLGRFAADGLILSTPTGSTAYGLAAGGPIIHPAASVIGLVPICPHSLSFRPMVIPATDPVEIICEGNPHGDEMLISSDGQDPLTLCTGDRVIVCPAAEHATLVTCDLFSFYERLRDKLHWGSR